MTLALDTSALIEIEKGNKYAVDKIEELSKLHPLPAKLPFITYFEFIYGISEKSPKNKEKLIAFIEKFLVIQTTNSTAQILSQLKHRYDSKGIAISLSDLFIAAQAIENNLTLVTKDRHFECIEELQKIML